MPVELPYSANKTGLTGLDALAEASQQLGPSLARPHTPKVGKVKRVAEVSPFRGINEARAGRGTVEEFMESAAEYVNFDGGASVSEKAGEYDFNWSFALLHIRISGLKLVGRWVNSELGRLKIPGFSHGNFRKDGLFVSVLILSIFMKVSLPSNLYTASYSNLFPRVHLFCDELSCSPFTRSAQLLKLPCERKFLTKLKITVTTSA